MQATQVHASWPAGATKLSSDTALVQHLRRRINTDLHNLETHTGDITLGVAGTTETGDENLVVLINEVEATVVRHEGRDLLTVLDELNTHALTHSGVRLLGLDTNLLENDPLSVRATGERLGPLLAQVTTLVALVCPVVVLALGAQLATGAKSVGLTLHMSIHVRAMDIQSVLPRTVYR